MRPFLALAFAAVLFAACGSDSPPDFADAAPGAARHAIITGGDLPPGWREDESGSTLDNVALSPRCDVLTPEGAFPGAAAAASSATFMSLNRRSAQSFSAVFETAEAASAALAGLDATVDDCHEEFLDAVRRAAKEELEAQGINLGPLADIDVDIAKGDAPALGQESALYRVEVRVGVLGTRTEFNADIVLVREGRVVGVLLYSLYDPVDIEEEAAFLDLVHGRLQEAEAELP